MKSRKRFISVIFLVLLTFSGIIISKAQDSSKNIKVGPQPDGSILVPTNQLLRPAGFQVTFPGRPVDIALLPS